jgi:hypothetical protein
MPNIGKHLIDKRFANRPLPKKKATRRWPFLAIQATNPKAGGFDPTSMDQKS